VHPVGDLVPASQSQLAVQGLVSPQALIRVCPTLLEKSIQKIIGKVDNKKIALISDLKNRGFPLLLLKFKKQSNIIKNPLTYQ